MSSHIELIAGGVAYSGWLDVSVRRSMYYASGFFEVSLTEAPVDISRRNDAQTRQLVSPGQSCELRIDDYPVISGYVDELKMEYGVRGHTVSVCGRDKIADLVDCSARAGPGQWFGQSLEAIARDLCKPFGIPVTPDVDTGPRFDSFALETCESVFEALDRAAAMRRVLMQSDGRGTLVITRAGLNRVKTGLVLGENILRASGTLDVRDRFSEYSIFGQAAGDDFFNAKQAAQMRGRAFDPHVKRYRPLDRISDHSGKEGFLRERAQWEANFRASRSTDISITVQGWRHADGLWEPNTLVRVRDGLLRLDDELLIAAVHFQLDEGGEVTELKLTRADAFQLEPIATPSPNAVSGFRWDLPKVR